MMTTLPWKLHAPGCVTTRSGGCILSTTQQFTENSIKEGKQFPEVFVATVALNQAVLFTTLQHLYVLPPVTFLCEFRFAYETYHRRILFSNVFYFSVGVSSSHGRLFHNTLPKCVNALLLISRLDSMINNGHTQNMQQSIGIYN